MATPARAADPRLPPAPADAAGDLMVLDGQTLKDLEVFESERQGRTLFDFCNFTRNKGGAKVLRRRMEQPWSTAARIRATQEALSCILARRTVFAKLPSLAHSGPVEHYIHAILPIVTSRNFVEFGIGALELWITHDRHYSNIVRGVQVACALIRSLRAFASQAELDDAGGELQALIAELRLLLARPLLDGVPDEETGGWGLWRILRADQVFRQHELGSLTRLLQLIYELDALVSLADATQRHGLLLPQIEEGALRVQAEGLVHPLLQDAVANPVGLDQYRRVLFLTGPNMAGKTTYLRACAIALYFAHLGMGVPARRFSFVPAQRLFSSISLSDDLSSGVSYFRAEALRVKVIAQAVWAGYRVIALLDEPFKGTNVKDALDASSAILERFAAKPDCLFMFSSHLIELSDQLDGNSQVDCRHFEADEREGRLRFAYELRAGISSQRLGMRVLREEGIFDLLDGERERL